MSYAAEISAQAETDLRGGFEYIASKLRSVQNAAGRLSRLEESIRSQNQTPERCRRYEREPCLSRNMRLMPVDNHCVFYIPNNETGVVTIIRVTHGGRDIEAELARRTSEQPNTQRKAALRGCFCRNKRNGTLNAQYHDATLR